MDGKNDKRSTRTLNIIVVIIAIISAGASFSFWLDARHAAKSEFVSLAHRFESKKINDYIQQVNARSWQLEDRLSEHPNDKSAKEELRTLEAKRKDYEMQYQALLENAPKND